MLKQPEAMERADWTEEPEVEAPASTARGGAGRTLVGALMTRQVIHVRRDTSLETAAQLMLDNGISRLPVVDAAGRLLGVLTKTDLIEDQVDAPPAEDVHEAPARRGRGELSAHMHEIDLGKTAEEVMSRPALALTETDTVATAASIMAAHRVHGLPVVNSHERLVGIISSLDILAWIAGLE